MLGRRQDVLTEERYTASFSKARSTADTRLRGGASPNVHEDVVEIRVVQKLCDSRSTVEVHSIHLDAHTLVIADQEPPGHRILLGIKREVHVPHVGAAHLELLSNSLDDVLLAAVDGDGIGDG